MRLGDTISPLLLLAGFAAPDLASAQDVRSVRASTVHPYAGHVAEAAHRFGIPEAWIWAVMRVESAGKRTAVSRAGAMGLMQIMPGTWAQLRARHGLGRDPFDPRDNILAGAAYLRAMHDRYGNASAMLAAYNAGPGRYDDYVARGRPLPAETIAYLARLEPIVGETAGVQVAAALPPDPLAWRRAGLFVSTASAGDAGSETKSTGTTVAPEGARDLQTEGNSFDVDAANPSSQSAPTDTLFVPRAGAGRPQ